MILSGSAVAAWGPNRLDVCVVGSDNALHHKSWDGTAWSPGLEILGGESLGGVCLSCPAVAAWGPTCISSKQGLRYRSQTRLLSRNDALVYRHVHMWDTA
jgi:hypothetical protein